MKGKVKAIPVREITEKMQIIFKDIHSRWHIGIIMNILIGEKVWISSSTYCHNVVSNNDLKRLAVEYESYDVYYPDDDFKGNVKTLDEAEKESKFSSGYYTIKPEQLSLEDKQWQSVIDNGEIDSEREVEFEIITDIAMVFEIQYAKIIRQRENKYSSSVYGFNMDICRAYNAGKQAMLDQRDGKPFKSSDQYFREEFPNLAEKI